MATAFAERRFTRTTFAKGAGGLVIAFGLPRLLDPHAARAAVAGVDPVGIGPTAIDPSQIDSWLAIGTDGTVTMKTGKVELGQGTITSSLQLVADELDVPLSSVKFVQSDTWVTPDQGATAGSQSTGTETGPAGLRQAAAEARLALLTLASSRLGAPVSNLTVSNGTVSVAGNPSQSVSYATLVGGALFNLPITGKATPKPYTAYKIVGTSVPRVDIPAKVFGTFTYTQDIRVPGMLYARVVRPPTLDSKLVSIDGWPGGKPANVVQVVQKGNYVAVVATTEWDAIIAAGTIKVTWDVVPLPSWATFNDDLKNGPSQDVVIQDSKIRGSAVVPPGQDVDAVLAATPASRVISETYKYPIQMHGSMGTCGATALVDTQRQVATVWSPTQAIYPLRAMLSTALGFPAQNIHCIYTEGSGCYGENQADDVSLDAAVISQLVGRPIRVVYMREDEQAWENFGQAYTISITAAVDTSGPKPKVTAWKRDSWTSTRGGRPGPPASVASGILMGFPEPPFPAMVSLTPSQDLNSVDASNSAPAYIIPAARLTNHTVSHTLLSGPLRSPARLQTTFSNEVMMDELAHLAGADPVNFRLDHLQDPRLIAVIQAAAALAKWEYGPRAAAVGKGRALTGTGMAAVHYEGALGYNAAVVNLTVDTKTGKIAVNHVWSAQDCGPAINPDGQNLQAEGCVMQGISRSLIEEVKWGPNGISTRDWATYPVIRYLDMPEFDFQVISRTDQPAVGAGEVLITNMPAAISNAIFGATGKRMRQVPFTRARVKAALAA
ncbi:MAG TPA: molybdopterin cofactor-binding domain-containing protein [Gaiellaceae bacterium]|nr:molybdopterin cofactor-binding domain-containing protein [Gaiellaceae bacterium]